MDIIDAIKNMDFTLEEVVSEVDYPSFKFYVSERTNNLGDLKGGIGELCAEYMVQKLAEDFQISREYRTGFGYKVTERVNNSSVIISSEDSIDYCEVDNLFFLDEKPYSVEAKLSKRLRRADYIRRIDFSLAAFHDLPIVLELRFTGSGYFMTGPNWHHFKFPLNDEITSYADEMFSNRLCFKK